jgi:molybdate transport system substrate-binding protein
VRALFVFVILFPSMAMAEEPKVSLRVLAAGATEATLRDTIGGFAGTVELVYAPVGALRDQIVAGDGADVTVVTPAIIADLEARKLVRAGSRVDLGRVGGGIAVRAGAPAPRLRTSDDHKRALIDADEVYYADPSIATAGSYFMKVVDRLGIGDAVRKKGHFPGGGREAMLAMAASKGRAIGVTQVSEILSVPSVTLVAPYPAELQNDTTYSAVILEKTTRLEAARAFLAFLTSPVVKARLTRSGFTVTGATE